MSTSSPRPGTQPRRNNVRNALALWQNYRKRAGPKFVGQLGDQLSIARWHIHNSPEPIAIRQMNNERIEARPFLRFKNFRDGNQVERLSGESVNSFRGQRDKFAFPQ